MYKREKEEGDEQKRGTKKEWTDDDDAFFYDVDFDSRGWPIIGIGSDKNHCHIKITSKRLMENLLNNGIHHIDGTYRITTHGN